MPCISNFGMLHSSFFCLLHPPLLEHARSTKQKLQRLSESVPLAVCYWPLSKLLLLPYCCLSSFSNSAAIKAVVIRTPVWPRYVLLFLGLPHVAVTQAAPKKLSCKKPCIRLLAISLLEQGCPHFASLPPCFAEPDALQSTVHCLDSLTP